MTTRYPIPRLIVLLAVALATCGAAVVSPLNTAPAAPADFPAAYYLQAVTQGDKILQVDSRNSLVTIEVYRAGLFTRLGHDHVVASRDVAGYISVSKGVADLYVTLDNLIVDDPGLRSAAGMNTQPSQQDIEGTRRNMLTRTLDAAHFPFALIHIARNDDDRLKITITLHGITRSYAVAAQLESVPGGISVAGGMSLNQSDFGITPLSILGGAIRVQDKVDLHFQIIALDN